MENQYFIIDFDSTFVTVEALDQLAKIALKNNLQKEKIAEKVQEITRQGMEGEISISQSLEKRFKLFKANKTHVSELISFLKGQITPSVMRNKSFFQKYADHIYIITGGFQEYVYPIVKEFGIEKSHVCANTFKFDAKGNITGYDSKNPLSHSHGKPTAVKKLGLKGNVTVVGDGYTDFEIKQQGAAEKFFAFTEHVNRNSVTQKADKVLANFDELLYYFNFPRSLSYPKSKIKVLLLENINQQAIDLFEKEGYKVETIPGALSEEELLKKIGDISVLGIRSKTEVTKKVLNQTKKLLAIGAFCIGTNQIDLAAAAQKGVAAFNAPYSNTRSVVELVMGEIIMLYRKTFDKNVKMHKGIWDKSSANCFEIRGKKLGIVGYGNIGTQLSVVAESLGMKVFFYDTIDKLSLGNAVKCSSLEELLKVSDVVTVHVDGRKSNTLLIGEKEFSLMKDGVIFLNLSRGHIVDVNALAQNIKSGKIAGCAVDVFPAEPKSNKDPFSSPLQGLPNVILTPHIGGSTEEAQRNIGEFVASKLITFVNTGNTTLSVNFPQLNLPDQARVHRLIHTHKNIPGVLANINKVLADYNINVEGQYLKTNEDIGYVITDVNKASDESVVKSLKEIPGTIRVRVLY